MCRDIRKKCWREGNRQATDFISKTLQSFGWKTHFQEFSAIDWHDGGATLRVNGHHFEVFVSPYSLDFRGSAQLGIVSNISDLENGNYVNRILLLDGELTKEPLMPKNFYFYNPDEHKRINNALEISGAYAFVCATGRNTALAGGVYPFPLIEDGDFNTPSVYMTEEEGARLNPLVGKRAALEIVSKRIPGDGYNVIGTIGKQGERRIVITAHVDSKKGTPGATDNATGITVLLLLAELLQDFEGKMQIEIVALNGEDYYSAPGQMKYMTKNRDNFESIILNINIDGAGYMKGKTTFSFFDLPEELSDIALNTIENYPDIKEGILWPQGDHSMFLQYGVPAIAVSSEWFTEYGESQDITHTKKDNISIVDIKRVTEIANVLNQMIREINKQT